MDLALCFTQREICLNVLARTTLKMLFWILSEQPSLVGTQVSTSSNTTVLVPMHAQVSLPTLLSSAGTPQGRLCFPAVHRIA